MTYYIDSTIDDTANNVTYYTLASGEGLYVGPQGLLAMTGSGSGCISTAGSAAITVAGTLFSSGTAVTLGFEDGLTITSTGQIDGGITVGNTGDGSASIYNAGWIDGVYSATGYVAVNNVGTMDGGVSAAQLDLRNVGTMTDNVFAGSLSSFQQSYINNSGSITSFRTVIELLGQDSQHVINSGKITFDGSAGFEITGAFYLGSGDDSVINTGSIIGDVYLNAGNDTLDSGQGHIAGIISGGAGNDELTGGSGDDTLDGGSGTDVLDGGSGNNMASYQDALTGVTVDLLDAARNTGDAAGDVYDSIERLFGSSANDKLYGDNATNRLHGYFGNDLLEGRDGNDRLYGDYGDDTLVGGAGNDRLDGGDGINTADYRDSTEGVKVSLAIIAAQDTKGAGEDTLINIQALTGSDFNDTLTGGSGDDKLHGEAGNDSLDGGLGNDVLYGDGGKDVFRFDTALGATNIDMVKGYDVGSDKIDLSHKIFAAAGADGTLSSGAFHIGTAAHDASDRIIYNPSTGALSYDADGSGSGAAIQFATLAHHLALTHNDFVIVG